MSVVGVGSYVPEKVLTNKDLERRVDTSDEWIRTRTGIRERRILAESEKPSDMSVHASRQALEESPVEASDIDLIVMATNLSDLPIPGSAPFLARELDLRSDIPFFDVKAGCSGFIYGLDIASKYLLDPQYGNALVVGLEALSRILDWDDRRTCVLFGDGAGAAVVSQKHGNGRIFSSRLYGDPQKAHLLTLEMGGSRFPADKQHPDDVNPYLHMDGQGVFKSAVNMMTRACEDALSDTSLTIYDVDWVIPHQANIRIIRKLAERLNVDMDRVVVNLQRYANTSTATIPLALHEALEKGLIDRGDVLLLTAFGAGATYGSMLLEW